MKNDIIYQINQSELIIIILYCSTNKIFRYDEKRIIYINKNNNLEYLLFDDFIIYALNDLKTCLCKAMKNELELHKALNNDLGYLWNEIIWGNGEKAVYYEKNGENFWVGDKNLLWSSSDTCHFSTWIYNKNKKIILEITPTFRWNPDIPEEEEQKNYEKFLKNYKPLVITEISNETAKEWLEKTERLIAQIEANDI